MIERSERTDSASKNGQIDATIKPAGGKIGTTGPTDKTTLPSLEAFPYIFDYSPDSLYGNVVNFASQYISPGLIVDLGAGAGTLGVPLQEAGFDYVAVERDEAALRLLSQRNIRNYAADLSDLASLEKTLDAIHGVRAYLLIDVIEHLENPEATLHFLSTYARAHGSPHLIVSVPNVGHRDVAYHLLGGRWNVTDTGLLDRTHLHLFTAPTLRRLLTASGWQLVARDDFAMEHSDQYDPRSLLHNASLISDFLQYVNDMFNPDNRINQFLWLLKPSAPHAMVTATKSDSTATELPLISLLIRTQGKRNDLLTEALYSIYAQDCDDYEVVVCFHTPGQNEDMLLKGLHDLIRELPVHLQKNVRLIECAERGRSAPLNALIESARGKYFGLLDDDDILFSRHVSTLERGTESHGFGPIFQTFAARRRVSVREKNPGPDDFGFRVQMAARNEIATYPYAVEMIEPAWITPFDPLRQQYENGIPNCCFLVPRSLIEQTNMRFRLDFDLAEDWEFLMRAAQLLRVVTLPEITAAINVRNNASNTVQNADLQPGWAVAHRKRLDEQAARPILLDGCIAHELFRRHMETAIEREQTAMEREQTAVEHERQLAARDRRDEELIAWAQGLEQTLTATQHEYRRQAAWAQDLERRLQSRQWGRLRSLVRRVGR